MIAGGIGAGSRVDRGARGYEADDAERGVPGGIQKLAFQRFEAPSEDAGLAGVEGRPQALQAPQFGGTKVDLDLRP